MEYEVIHSFCITGEEFEKGRLVTAGELGPFFREVFGSGSLKPVAPKPTKKEASL